MNKPLQVNQRYTLENFMVLYVYFIYTYFIFYMVICRLFSLVQERYCLLPRFIYTKDHYHQAIVYSSKRKCLQISPKFLPKDYPHSLSFFNTFWENIEQI